MQQITCTDPYTGSTPYRDCLYGTVLLDLRDYRNEWNAKVQVSVELVRPLAQYEIIATDVKEFLAESKNNGRQVRLTASPSPTASTSRWASTC